ncbi:hypothetical protein [Pseudomonas sp. BN606]|uniref:hypothetical protein n=1 Tax=unclassified Pseudomonas TaxID=196821 RepID=UPI00129E1A57|nr:hypothetical protein [Pseudomonas sp. BN606]MDH4653352.1 hypothetical protein [Pseudomonas sp. BN606]MRK20683.1 hypothetical protein [Pseudomonas sp. JG-B]
MQQARNAGKSNSEEGSVVRLISAASTLSWLSPPDKGVFEITSGPALPEIIFEFKTDVDGDYEWSWVIEWEAKASGLREKARNGKTLQTFNESGKFVGKDKKWMANFGGRILGGKLTVAVLVGGKKLERSVMIRGQNPSKEDVATYVANLEDMGGFDKLLEQETGSKHFISLDGEPIVAFDKGYGVTQMTNPAPTYEQAWNWKENITAGSSLYREKVRLAEKYLGQSGRTYSDEQLQHEAFSRWNGGSYHEWDASSKSWMRRKNLLCDSQTGNIGWLTNKEENKDKTESELRERDKDTYKLGAKGQSSDHSWIYSGVCYADHVLAD